MPANPELERILADDYLGEVTSRSIEEVREMRAECQAVETGLSYVRRLVQGRLDIVGTDQARRLDGGPPGDLGDLIGRLPEILSDRTRSPGTGRLPQTLAPGDVQSVYADELDTIIPASQLGHVPEMGDGDIEALAGRLEDLEQRVSATRRALFDRIDALQAELTRRYRTGEASVETLLK